MVASFEQGYTSNLAFWQRISPALLRQGCRLFKYELIFMVCSSALAAMHVVSGFIFERYRPP
jgi:hypothetical protein